MLLDGLSNLWRTLDMAHFSPLRGAFHCLLQVLWKYYTIDRKLTIILQRRYFIMFGKAVVSYHSPVTVKGYSNLAPLFLLVPRPVNVYRASVRVEGVVASNVGFRPAVSFFARSSAFTRQEYRIKSSKLWETRAFKFICKPYFFEIATVGNLLIFDGK